MYCKIFHLRSFKITTVNWVRYRSVCCYGQQSKCVTGSMYNSFRQYLIVVDRIWIFKQLCENSKDPQHVFSSIFLFWRISENCPPNRSSHPRRFFFYRFSSWRALNTKRIRPPHHLLEALTPVSYTYGFIDFCWIKSINTFNIQNIN